MFELFKALLLGAVQGITEFLPVSSTGHLILLEKLLHVSQDKYGLTFDAALHLGTLIAVLWFFKDTWFKLLKSLLTMIKKQKITTADERLVTFLVIGTIPAMILGLLLEKKVETAFRSPVLVAIMLIIFSFVLLYVEKVGRKYKTTDAISTIDSLIIGTAQGIALIPGVSRSGITIAAGMWRGMKREEATRFAFLLSAPIIAGAGGLQLLHVIKLIKMHTLVGNDVLFFVVGIISSTFFGYVTIKYFIQFVSKNSLKPFIVYRIVLGIAVLVITVFAR